MAETKKLKTRACAAAMLAAMLITAPAADASVKPVTLISADIAQAGAARELRFGFAGLAPRWKLSAHGQELWIDLPHTTSRTPPRPLFGREAAPLAAVRVLDTGSGGVRIVLQVEGKTDYAIARLRHQIVVRIAPAGAVPNLAAALLTMREPRETPAPAAAEPPGAAPSREPPAVAPPPARVVANGAPTRGHPLVMIDPGHGGYDPGASSADGIEEKNLALEIAIRLRTALEARGINAAMTRTTDEFVALGGRTRIANGADADLFVSIHLNSSPNPATTGIEVYYLNNTTDRATIRLARMENAQSAGGYGASGEPNLNYILTDLRQQYKATEAASLARMIDAQTVADLDAGFGINVNALGARRGPFYVLVGAHMPAVLVECGFLSNQAEAQRLASAQYQQILASGVAAAIVHYLNADAAVGNL
ncbi:MAG TPA: N-acetylmuramoyl-L-alanine amidase [Candidatus Binataceae bacterium]|nr:N-acetylmuramoyl-L-alanine amidase [Candidatus Binataceae bacterium]